VGHDPGTDHPIRRKDTSPGSGSWVRRTTRDVWSGEKTSDEKTNPEKKHPDLDRFSPSRRAKEHSSGRGKKSSSLRAGGAEIRKNNNCYHELSHAGKVTQTSKKQSGRGLKEKK